jgi:small subunit ribosomal protein S16
MLAIRMQRTGRSGHAQFRLIVQDARRSPKSNNIVIALGSYDPHTKQVKMDKEKAAFYLAHGAQPSSRVALLLQKEGIKLPKWIKAEPNKKAAIRTPEKRRSTRPAEAETPNESTVEQKPAAEEPTLPEQVSESPAAEESIDVTEAAAEPSDETEKET